MKIAFTALLNLVAFVSNSQSRSVSITIDDLPNVGMFEADGSSRLLSKLDSIHVPVAIFINEVNLFQSGTLERNKLLLKSWIDKDFITTGNHSYSHQNYADISFEAFSQDVIKGETVTRELLSSSGKTMKYFRFPFNSLGKDSTQYAEMNQFLIDKKYISTPYTVESEDWLYTQLYEKALADGNGQRAREIGSQYVQTSLKIFGYFDSLSVAMYGRSIKQIYLCHDNRLNTDYLPKLIQGLKDQQYQFVRLDEALQDPVYKSKDYYTGRAGFSWIYRWIADPKKRIAAMRAEPENVEIHKAYEEMNKKK